MGVVSESHFSLIHIVMIVYCMKVKKNNEKTNKIS